MTYDYDIIILGGGPAGLVAAKVARGLGKRVALIEKTRLGGTCTLTGCVPSKTLIHIAKLVHDSKKLDAFGQTCAFTVDSKKVMSHIHAMVEEIYQGHSVQALETLGIHVLFGNSTFINKNHVRVSGDQHHEAYGEMTGTRADGDKKKSDERVSNGILSAKKFIIATGSRPFIPTIPGLDTVPYLTNETLFTLERLPASLLILGGGPVGVEIAAALQRLGTQCTIVERLTTILAREDSELVPLVTAQLMKDGVEIKTSVTVKRVTKAHLIKNNHLDSDVSHKNTEEQIGHGGPNDTASDGITLECIDSSGETITLSGEQLFIAVGRRPNSEELALQHAGIAMGSTGVLVNKHLQTTTANIYACGDIVGPYQFSHMAEYQASLAARNACIPFFKKSIDSNQKIWVTFIDPEFAVQGLTEAEALKQYPGDIVIYRSYYNKYDRPRIDSETTGMAKIICRKNGKIVGAHIFGARAGELINQIQLGSYYNLKLRDFYKPITPYPTYSDVIWQVAKRAYIDSLANNRVLTFLRKIFAYFAR